MTSVILHFFSFFFFPLFFLLFFLFLFSSDFAMHSLLRALPEVASRCQQLILAVSSDHDNFICKLLHDNTRLESKIKLTKFIEISDLVWRYVLWYDVVCILFFCLYSRWGKSKFTVKFKFHKISDNAQMFAGMQWIFVQTFWKADSKMEKSGVL